MVGKIAGLQLSVDPLMVAGGLVLFAVLGEIALGVLHASVRAAIAGAVLAVILHYVSVLAHQFGHAWAAEQTGHPMSGIRLGTFGLLSTSIYPKDEPPLPAAIHIRRALGGAIGSVAFTLVAAATALALREINPALGWVGVFFVFDTFVVLGLGALLPLGFTDGSTLLYWWPKR